MGSLNAFAARVTRLVGAGRVLPLGATVRLYGGTDKWTHGYTASYEKHLADVRWRRNRVIEIGVGGYEGQSPGGSLRVWRDYLPRSTIVGLDLHQKQLHLGRRVRFVQGDQSVPSDLLRAVEALGGPPNIVIDDGSHLVGHAVESFRTLFPMMPSGALYVIEDLHTSYWDSYGGDVPAPDDTAIGLVKSLVDASQENDPIYAMKPHWGSRPPIVATGIGAIHVYPGIVFIDKAVVTHPAS